MADDDTKKDTVGDLPLGPSGVPRITIPRQPEATGVQRPVPKPGEILSGHQFKGGDPSKEENWVRMPEPNEVIGGHKFKGGDPSKKENWEKVQKFPSGIEGTVTAQIQGQLHGFSEAVGSPVDLVASGLRAAGVPVGDNPVLGSKNIRQIMDIPGDAAGWLADEIGGKGTAEKWGLGGHATYEDINEIPSSYRAQAQAGNVVGNVSGTLLPIGLAGKVAGVTQKAAVTSGSAIKDIVRQQALEAQGSPLKQLPAAAGAAGGAYAAETIDPGSENAQLAAQLFGGIGLSAMTGGAGKVASMLRRPVEPIMTSTPEGAKTSIARSLGKAFDKAKESPEEAIHNLKTPPVIPGASPAEQSGSRLLLGIEESLRKKNPDLENTLQKRNENFSQTIQSSIEQSFKTGDRGALTRAAQGIQAQVDALVTRAENEARSVAATIEGAPAGSREALNVQARNILEQALRDARQAESELWRKVPNDAIVDPDKTKEAFRAIRKEVIEDRVIPGTVFRALSSLKKSPLVTLERLQKIRSEALRQARMARGIKDYDTARLMTKVANAILADTESIPGNDAQLARAYSYELNNRFSRSWAANVLGTSESGAPEIRPALTMESTVSGKPQLVAQKLKELQLAATGIPKQIDEQGKIVRPEALSPEMRSVQEGFLQSLSNKITDPDTGRLNTRRAVSFLRDYESVLDQFPLYRQKIENAITAQLGAERMAGLAQEAQRSAFASVIESGEVPMKAVAKALSSPTPNRSFTELAQMARQGGDDAVGGLRATILDFVMDRSIAHGNLSYVKAKQKLLSPLYEKGPSLLELMVTNGVIDKKEAQGIADRLNAAIRHEMASAQALRVDEVGDEGSKLARMGSRILGAKLASKLGFTHGGAGPSLQIAQIAAQAAEDIITKLPLDAGRKVLTDAIAADTPEQLIDILERISNVGGLKSGGADVRYLIPLLRDLYPRQKSISRRHTLGTPATTRMAPKSMDQMISQ